MKKLVWLAAVTASFLLAGCASKDDSVEGVQHYTQCTYPDSPSDEAPAWICDVMPKDLTIGASGYAKKSIFGMTVMKKIAVNNARLELANIFKTNVTNMFRQALKSDRTTSLEQGNIENAVEAFENVTQSVTNQTLTNSRIIVSQVSPAGGLYVLVGMDDATYQENIERVQAAAKAKDSELRAQFTQKKTEASLLKALDALIK